MLRLNFENKLSKVNLTSITNTTYNLSATSGVTHTDINRIKEGRLGAQFWVVYTLN